MMAMCTWIRGKKKPMTSNAQLAAQKRYDEKNTRQIKMKLNRVTDKEIIDWLDQQENKQGYLKRLIEKDMRESE